MSPSGFAAAALGALALTAALLPVQAQKVEREYGIDAEQMPPPALAYLDSAFAVGPRRRRSYYRDVGEDGTTAEAKFKFADRWYSVEFDTTGQWLDTEVEIPVTEVPAAVWSQVCDDWARRYERFRVARVQEHRGRGGETFYEVELRTRVDYEWDRYEVKLDPDGRVLEEQVIELAPGHLDRW